MIRVVLADDQSVVRAGFRVILELAGDIEVVGECADGPTAVRLARRLAPDVVCMDVRMPGGDGLSATREITSGNPGGSAPAVLVVTTFDLDEYVFGALEAGASGFVLKDTEPDDLIDAVRRLARGQGLVDQSVTRRVIAEFARRRPAQPSADAAHELTARETDIVRLLAQGMSNAEIARELVIETSTVKSHLGRAMAKIGVRDRLQTVVWAYQNGMVPQRPA
ncbi:response regulator [Pseudonocardia cypriaca]|uniref:LuxR family two component transcriptional regulator n=1 Tax=Pseudonocardia cypriaca TaxID=882449 RepID=A0A543G9Z3_9PSEU|nr:response regulator transcription factor [Pseudonocardia cypriaca]TQM42882.1 LuxR family two component transcriptional regulator [Pseudonocardia cypriaca]